jgi:hypothetical protein
MDFQRETLVTSSPMVDRRGARPRRGAIRRRNASPTPGTSNPPTRRRRPPSDSAAVPLLRLPHAGISQPLNHGSEVQSHYTLPPRMNVDIYPRSFAPVSMGAFESQYRDSRPSLINSPQAERRSSNGSSFSSYSSPPNEILSNSDFGLYPDTMAYLNNSSMLNSGLPTQRHGSTSSSSLSTDTSAYEYRRNQRCTNYDFRARVNSEPSIAHAVIASPSNVFQQGIITDNNPSLHVAEPRYPLSYSLSASTTSSSLDNFFSPTSYVPSRPVNHLADVGLQVQPYARDVNLQHQSSFSPYTLPNDMGADGTFDPFHYNTTHQS